MSTYPRTIPKADGALYEIRKGIYKRVVYVGLDKRGRQRQRSRTFPAANDTEARRLGKRYAVEMEDAPETRREQPTVADLVDRWRRDIESGKSPTTSRGRSYLVDAIRAELGPIKLVDLTAADVDEWLAKLRKSKADTTVSNHHAMLRAILGQGVKWKMVPDREATDQATPPPRERYREPEPPTPAVFGLLLEQARPDLRLAALLAAGAGLRRGEVLGLRWSDIAYTDGGAVLRIRRSAVDVGKAPNVERTFKPPKTRKARTVEVGHVVAEALRAHRLDLRERCKRLGGRLADDGPVLADVTMAVDGSVRRRVDWVTLSWDRLVSRVGGAHFRFHDLRHMHASYLFDQGLPIHLVQKQMGHARASTTTDIYGHAAPAGGRLAAAIDDMLAIPS
jgi:integrase